MALFGAALLRETGTLGPGMGFWTVLCTVPPQILAEERLRGKWHHSGRRFIYSGHISDEAFPMVM